MITGAYVRVQRDGKWDSIDIARLSQGELETLSHAQPERGWLWVKFLVKWIQDNIEIDEEGQE